MKGILKNLLAQVKYTEYEDIQTAIGYVKPFVIDGILKKTSWREFNRFLLELAERFKKANKSKEFDKKYKEFEKLEYLEENEKEPLYLFGTWKMSKIFKFLTYLLIKHKDIFQSYYDDLQKASQLIKIANSGIK